MGVRRQKEPKPRRVKKSEFAESFIPREVGVIGARWHEIDRNSLLNLKRCKGFETFGTVAMRDTTGKKTGTKKKCAKQESKLS